MWNILDFKLDFFSIYFNNMGSSKTFFLIALLLKINKSNLQTI